MYNEDNKEVPKKKVEFVLKNRLTEEELKKRSEERSKKRREYRNNLAKKNNYKNYYQYVSHMSSLTPEENFLKRFWDKVDKKEENECWIWTAYIDKDGYGTIKCDGKTVHAHRISYIIHYGEIPKDKPHICHRCDNPSCVNPKHLFSCTHADNIKDRTDKGRSYVTPPEMSNLAKLSWKDVNEIREKHKSWISVYELSEEYHVSLNSIYNIINNVTWKI